MTQTKKNALLMVLFVVSVVSAGAIGRATADCPEPVTDCPVVIDQGVLDQYCPECQECPVVEPTRCPEAPCPPPEIRHPVEIRVEPAALPATPRHRFDLTGLVATDLDAASLQVGWNWKYSRIKPVFGVLWTDPESRSSPYDPPYRTFRNWTPPSPESSSGAWRVLLGVQVGFL